MAKKLLISYRKKKKKRLFRVVHAPVFLCHFASDRRHVKDSDGTWIAQHPPYEPIVAKGHVFAFGELRALAIANMVLGLKEMIHIRVKIRTNIDYTIDLLNVSEYRDNKIHTGWLDSRIAMRVRADRPPWYHVYKLIQISRNTQRHSKAMVRGRSIGRVAANHDVVGHGTPHRGTRVPVPRVLATARGLRTNVLRRHGLGRGVGRGALPVDEVVAETSVHVGQDYVPEVTQEEIVVPPIPVVVPLGDFQQVFQMFMQQQNANQGIAEDWMKQVKKIFKNMGCPDEEKVECTTFHMKNEAWNWWEMIERNHGLVPPMAWAEFKVKFFEQYFPQNFRHQMTTEFYQLIQEKMSVSQYKARFTELSRYALAVVADEESKVVKFMEGLLPPIRARCRGFLGQTYAQLVSQALEFEQDYQSNIKLKKYKRTYKKKEEDDSSIRQGHQDAQGQNRKCQRDDRPLDSRAVIPRAQGARIPGPCYYCGEHDHLARRCPRREGQQFQQRSHEQGQLQRYQGQTSRQQGLEPDTLETQLIVTTPLGSSSSLNRVCRDCPVVVYDFILPADLIVLPIEEFGIILDHAISLLLSPLKVTDYDDTVQDLHEDLIATVFNILYHEDNIFMFAKNLDAVISIIEVLGTGNAKTQSTATAIILKLSTYTPNRIIEHDGVHIFLNFLRKSSEELNLDKSTEACIIENCMTVLNCLISKDKTKMKEIKEEERTYKTISSVFQNETEVTRNVGSSFLSTYYKAML
ncbi:hypothetical protein GIB67_024936, partial [Kingdonia uniflora]